MLDRTQEQLLMLLREVDEICRENDITYFLDGGTVIGGARHEGFIPWDNDADIGMTEENYNRFVEAVNRRTKETHRTVQDITVNPEYPLEIGRYIDLDMTKITITSAFWNVEDAMSGLMIDVFKLVPLPKDEKEKARFCDLFNAYSEYCNESNRRSGRRTDYFDRLYGRICFAGRIFGKARVKSWLEKKLFNRKCEDYEYYMYGAAGRKTPRIFPKEMYDLPPVRVKFEDLELPITPLYHEYLRLFYGEDYWKIPESEGQIVHAAIDSEIIPYRYIVKDYMRMLSADRIRSRRKAAKDAFVTEARLKKPLSEKTYSMSALAVRMAIEKRIRDERINLRAEYENRNFALLDDLFDDYYKVQFSPGCKYWPILVELEEEHLYYALMNLITGRSNVSRPGWVLNTYKEKKSETLPPMLSDIKLLLDCLFTARSCFDYGRDEEGVSAVRRGLEVFPDSRELRLWELMYEAKICDAGGEALFEKHAAALLEEYPDCPDVIKARGDLLWRKGMKKEAMELYDSIYDSTFDGMIRLDIERKRRSMND